MDPPGLLSSIGRRTASNEQASLESTGGTRPSLCSQQVFPWSGRRPENLSRGRSGRRASDGLAGAMVLTLSSVWRRPGMHFAHSMAQQNHMLEFLRTRSVLLDSERRENPSLCQNQAAVQMECSAHLFSRSFLEANTSPLPGGAYSKSAPTVEGHSRFRQPANALQSTWFPSFQKGSASPGRSRPDPRRLSAPRTRDQTALLCFSSRAPGPATGRAKFVGDNPSRFHSKSRKKTSRESVPCDVELSEMKQPLIGGCDLFSVELLH